MSVSRARDLLYAPGDAFTPSYRVVWVDRNGASEPLTQSTGYFQSVALSPDERRLACSSAPPTSIWTYDIGRATMAHLDGGTRSAPVEPGRERLYLNGNEIHAVDVDTRGDLTLGNPRVLFEIPFAFDGFYGISSDGQRLVFID